MEAFYMIFAAFMIALWAAYRVEREDACSLSEILQNRLYETEKDLISVRKKYSDIILQTCCCPSEKKQYEAAFARVKNLENEIRMRRMEKEKLKRQLSSAKGQITKLKKKLENCK